jgi:hypothetical protein
MKIITVLIKHNKRKLKKKKNNKLDIQDMNNVFDTNGNGKLYTLKILFLIFNLSNHITLIFYLCCVISVNSHDK